MFSPYRSPATPQWVRSLAFERLEEHVAAVRAGLLTGVYATMPRSRVATMAADFEAIHTMLAQQVAATQSAQATGIAVCGTLAALSRSVFGGAFGVLIPLCLIGVIIFLGWGLYVMKALDVVLARTKDTAVDLGKLAMTLPVDDIPAQVRVDAEAVAGFPLEELATSPLQQERKS